MAMDGQIAKSLYQLLPSPAQELLLSSYFLLKRRRVRNATFSTKLAELRESERADARRIEALQGSLLERILTAAATTPHYRRLFADLRADPQDFATPERLRALPILDKDTVRLRPSDFVAAGAECSGATIAYTSGSTGSPLRVVLSPEYEAIEEAFVARQWAWAGIRDGSRRVRLRGDLVVPASTTSMHPWRRNLADNELRMSSYHLSRSTARRYIDRINRFRPDALIAYPSSANLLARFVEELGVRCPIPCVFTSSETLTTPQRAAIEQHLESTVYDHYGCTEAAVAISQCELGSYHVLPEYGVTELVLVADEPSGDVYDVVSTGLVNTAMPLLRYRTGDRVRVSANRTCRCERPFPVIDEILGRDDDFVLTPRGDWVGRLDHVYKGLIGITESQIRQEFNDRVRVLVVPGPGYDNAIEAQLVANLRSRLANMDVTVERVAAVPRGANGKFRAVVSTIANA